MGILGFVRDKLRRSTIPGSGSIEWSEEGVAIRFARALPDASIDALLDATDHSSAEETFLVAYLSQLVGEGKCKLTADGIVLPWQLVYELQEDAQHAAVVHALGLPTEKALRPILDSVETMADPAFDVKIAGWVDGATQVHVDKLQGAIARMGGAEYLLPCAAWATAAAIRDFSERPPESRTQHHNELAWGQIRAVAHEAGAFYSNRYLETTHVLTPQTLRMPLHREDTPFGRVLTVEPTFSGAPSGWLKAFDSFDSVQGHYDVTPKGEGLVRVVISEPVRRVLEVVKREMPNRKVAGSRAERFVHKPWAFLGESAHEVLDEEEFESDRAGAGSVAAVFSVIPRYRESRIEFIDLMVTEHFHGGASKTSTTPLDGPQELGRFVEALERALIEERVRFPWDEFDLSLDAEAAAQLELAKQLLDLWRVQPAEAISLEDIYQLEEYSERIEGIGPAKPIYVPLIQKPAADDEGKPGWMPGDLTPMVRVTLSGHEGQVIIPLTKEWVGEFERQVSEAEAQGAQEVRNGSLPTALGTSQARSLVNGFRTMLGATDAVKREGTTQRKDHKSTKETILVKTNFHGVDYMEERKASLALPGGTEAELPRSLRPSIKLKKHQLDGVAWFQHLVSRAPADCRGALLADDMGLGKTVQLLVVLGRYYEENPDAAPSLILAPKSLVDNWEAETKKFFTPSFPEVLVLYGSELQSRKQPLSLIDQELKTRGIVDLLRPRWSGTAKVIITTYDVLIGYEFSFARQPFAFVVCDEAQRIKTPGTRVSLAVRALKADFRIACTGTPVENSLADLWCLFDFVQPGLLGGLEEFGSTYRRPIECESEEQKQALVRLQDVIAPQTLRRTKMDIQKELKAKYFASKDAAEPNVKFKDTLDGQDRLEVTMSAHQSMLYLGGLKKLQDANSESDGRKRARLSFGALHLMKAVCAEPYCLPGQKFLPDQNGIDRHLENSPKLAWLLSQLQGVQAAGEKAIVFTELREVQAALFYFLRETFGLKPYIINGDSQNRQSYIEKFSAVDGFNVIILSTLAAGAGLNVTAANHVFHFTRAWNPAKENQATDRAYRIGQEKDVYVYCPIVVTTDFSTFDVRLDELMRRKAGLADATLGGSAMISMLNGTGRDVSISEILADGPVGAELPKRDLTMDDVDRLDGFRFEVLCQVLWSKRGFVASITEKRRGDGGIDVVALKGNYGELLQCKSSVRAEVGWDAVKEVTTGAALYQKRFAATKLRRFAVTNQRFTSGAREHAAANRVELIERADFERLLLENPVNTHEFDDAVVAAIPIAAAA